MVVVGYIDTKAGHLTLPMPRLISSKAQGRKDFRKPSKPCHVGNHWIALTEYSQMNNHMPGFQSFFRDFLRHFVLAKLATSSIKVKNLSGWNCICLKDISKIWNCFEALLYKHD